MIDLMRRKIYIQSLDISSYSQMRLLTERGITERKSRSIES
jgi:hypothetical protein